MIVGNDLITFTKLAAPFIPFLAEKVYQEIGGAKTSVHLEAWPKAVARVRDEVLETDMQWIRQAASIAHEIRVKQAIPVRQALASLKITFGDPVLLEHWEGRKDLLSILRDEVNVETVLLEGKTGLTDPWEITLDTVMTPELRKKGYRREFARHVMNLRKQVGLEPKDRAHVLFSFGEGEVREAMTEQQELLAKELRALSLEYVADWSAHEEPSEEIEIGGEKGRIALNVVKEFAE